MKYEVGYIILHNTEEFLTSKWSGGGIGRRKGMSKVGIIHSVQLQVRDLS